MDDGVGHEFGEGRRERAAIAHVEVGVAAAYRVAVAVEPRHQAPPHEPRRPCHEDPHGAAG